MTQPQTRHRSAQASAVALTDTRTLRERARQGMADGAVTAGYGPLRDEVLALLDSALATELVCMLRYRRHHFMARGVLSKPVADEFLVHATQELEHADWLAERIVQLGGAPDFDPLGLTARSHAQYIEGQTLAEMVRENLVAERIAIDSPTASASPSWATATPPRGACWRPSWPPKRSTPTNWPRCCKRCPRRRCCCRRRPRRRPLQATAAPATAVRSSNPAGRSGCAAAARSHGGSSPRPRTAGSP